MIDYFKLFPLLIGKCKWLRGCLCTMQCALLDRVTWNTWHIKKNYLFFYIRPTRYESNKDSTGHLQSVRVHMRCMY